MAGRLFFEYGMPTPLLYPTVTRSRNQSPSSEFYSRPPITLPNPRHPILPQFNDYLTSKADSPKRYGEPLYGGPYGKLGTTQDPTIVEMKGYLAELPPSISLEARGVMLTTLLNKFNPFILDSRNHLPPLYDHNRDRHLAQDVYGGNGLYKAVEEWVALAKGKLPGVREKVKLPWLAMHIRHTFLRNPQMIDKFADIQTAIDMIMQFDRHYRQPSEDEAAYIDRMAHPYWMAQEDLRKLNLLPGYQRVRTEPVAVRRY